MDATAKFEMVRKPRLDSVFLTEAEKWGFSEETTMTHIRFVPDNRDAKVCDIDIEFLSYISSDMRGMVREHGYNYAIGHGKYKISVMCIHHNRGFRYRRKFNIVEPVYAFLSAFNEPIMRGKCISPKKSHLDLMKDFADKIYSECFGPSRAGAMWDFSVDVLTYLYLALDSHFRQIHLTKNAVNHDREYLKQFERECKEYERKEQQRLREIQREEEAKRKEASELSARRRQMVELHKSDLSVIHLRNKTHTKAYEFRIEKTKDEWTYNLTSSMTKRPIIIKLDDKYAKIQERAICNEKYTQADRYLRGDIDSDIYRIACAVVDMFSEEDRYFFGSRSDLSCDEIFKQDVPKYYFEQFLRDYFLVTLGIVPEKYVPIKEFNWLGY